MRSLWLGKNKITEIKGLENLKNLKQLSLQNNRITAIKVVIFLPIFFQFQKKGLEQLTNLEELYLSFNGIVRMEGLKTLRSLKILDLSSNNGIAFDKEELVPLRGTLEELWFYFHSIIDSIIHHLIIQSFNQSFNHTFIQFNSINHPSIHSFIQLINQSTNQFLNTPQFNPQFPSIAPLQVERHIHPD